MTSDVQVYRELVAGIWRTHDAPYMEDWDVLRNYRELQWLLFDTVVLLKHDVEVHTRPDWMGGPAPAGFADVFVVPAARETPLLLAVKHGDHNYTSYEEMTVSPGDAQLKFTGFYDWDDKDDPGLKYLDCIVTDWKAYPHLAGRRVIIECDKALVFAPE